MKNLDLVGVFLISFIVNSSYSRIISTRRQSRLSLAEPMPSYFHSQIDGHPGTYSYGYDIQDPATGNTQFKTEERYPNGTVVGSYGYVDAWGRPRRYRYVADERGYRVMSDPPYKSYVPPTPAPVYNPLDSSITWTRPTKPSESSITWTRLNKPSGSSLTWTRPKNQNKQKYDNSNYYVNRPNLIGPPSAYIED